MHQQGHIHHIEAPRDTPRDEVLATWRGAQQERAPERCPWVWLGAGLPTLSLSARRVLEYAADLRTYDRSVSEREAAIARVIEVTALAPHATRRCRALTVGERLRVNLATELLVTPAHVAIDLRGVSLDEEDARVLDAVCQRVVEEGVTLWLVSEAR